jgi:hypothetical protein
VLYCAPGRGRHSVAAHAWRRRGCSALGGGLAWVILFIIGNCRYFSGREKYAAVPNRWYKRLVLLLHAGRQVGVSLSHVQRVPGPKPCTCGTNRRLSTGRPSSLLWPTLVGYFVLYGARGYAQGGLFGVTDYSLVGRLRMNPWRRPWRRRGRGQPGALHQHSHRG